MQILYKNVKNVRFVLCTKTIVAWVSFNLKDICEERRFIFSFLFPADKRQELFCHEPLTGDLLSSDLNSDGEFQAEQTVMVDFCQVRIWSYERLLVDI